MKKNLFALLLIVSCLALISQPAGKWSTGGNAIVPGDFIGTTNNFPFDFRVNNVQQMSLGINGILTLNSLSGIGNRILLTDANGNITAIPQGSPGQFLQSDGTWGSLPLSATAWHTIGNNLAFMGGNLGIGTSAPAYKLDVLGDARISSNLYVGGGIVVTDKLDASIEVKAGDVIVNNDLNVTGNSKLLGALTASKGIMFDNAGTIGISYVPPIGNNPAILYHGGPIPTIPPTSPCFAPNPPFMTNSFPGHVQIYDANALGNYTGGNILNLSSWFDGSSIDVAGGGLLLVNYFCGKDIALCTGTNGGVVYLGSKVSAQQNVGIGNSYPNPNYDPNVGLNIHANNTNMDGIRLNIWNGTVKAINLVHPSTGVSNFVVWQGGQTQIGSDKPLATGPHANAMLSVGGTGKIVAKSVYVTQQNWADFVFNKDYELPTWEETEKYFTSNKHLKGVPTAEEIREQGNSLGETDLILLKKIEEAYLYIGQLKQEVAEMKQMNLKLLKETKSVEK